MPSTVLPVTARPSNATTNVLVGVDAPEGIASAPPKVL
jgi:hypothetical protein